MVRALFFPLLLLGAVGATPPRRPAALAQAPCAVRFVMQVLPRQLAASGYCRNLLDQPAHYYYQLVLERWGRNRAVNTQSGNFELGPRQEAELAQTQMGEIPGDHYRLRLRVYDEAGRLLAQDSVRHDP